MRSFQTYTPRVRRLIYDALKTDLGCQSIAGVAVFGSLGFERICVFEHDAASGVFNQPDKTAYATGPMNTGNPPPWPTRWAAWVASQGIRVGKFPLVTLPSNGLGMPSSLFPVTSASKVSLGFTSKGMMGIAIQRTDGQIHLKWIKDEDGTYGDEIFTGTSPILFGNALLNVGVSVNSDLVLYYLKPAQPRAIFARFERDNFLVEYAVASDLPVDLERLISSEAVSGRQELYALDSLGRDVTLYSPVYSVNADGDKGSLDLRIRSGDYREAAIPVSIIVGNNTKLSLMIASGKYSDVIVEPGNEPDLSSDKAVLSIAIESGSYE